MRCAVRAAREPALPHLVIPCEAGQPKKGRVTVDNLQ